MRIWNRLRGALAGLAALAGADAIAQTGGALSPAVKVEARSITGLREPADIIVDHWGVPHIFAASERDAYFLQGYNAARDRLWQIDLWRKRGLGRLAASLGPAYVDQDRAARLFLYRGDMAKEWAGYSPDAQAIITAFTEGVNAYVRETQSGARSLPVEFRLTDSRPELWKPEDVLRIRSHTLVSNVASEVARARIACVGGLEADMLRRKLEPAHQTRTPKGLDPCSVPADVLNDYNLATQQVTFEALARRQGAVLQGDAQLAALLDRSLSEGSNNWVIAPSKSATGRAQMANDPHRQLGAPSLRYVVGLNAPGLTLLGAGEPALPGISLGHNGAVAFGITIFAMDQEDLYVYQLKPGDPTRYRYRGGWAAMETVRESIEVKGEAPREVELRFTRHGPVVKMDAAASRAFAMRSVWAEPGLAGYFGSSRLFKAKSWADFQAASNAWGAPPLNLVYADASGNIGWAPSGLAPVRRNWDGLMPVPGDGRYEWAGFHGKDALPEVYNPPGGFFATANEMNLPKGFPNEDRKIAFEWADRSRTDRIHEVLRADPSVTLADSAALQADAVNPISRRAVALLKGLSSTDADTARALDLLRGWDNHETTDSVAAAIYQVWTSRHLGRALVARATPEAARPLVGNGNLDAVLSFLEAPGDKLGKDASAARMEILLASLTGALDDLRQRLGPDMSTWRWGRLHQARFEPAIAVLADPQARAQMTVGPLATPGSANTPRAQTYNPSTFEVTAGASVRLVIDAGQWDNSTFINTPGQSTDPSSAHYRDLFPVWAEGRQVPLRFSRPAVERDASQVFRLTPAP
jgi:penicillin G amidase